MSTFTDEITQRLDTRILNLKREEERLGNARAALLLPTTSKRQVGGNRPRLSFDSSAKALEVIQAKPGISSADLGPAVGLSPTAGYRLVNRLLEQDKIVRGEHGGWYPR